MRAALTRTDLDASGCGTPNCDHDHSVLYLHGRCHPAAATRARYVKATGHADTSIAPGAINRSPKSWFGRAAHDRRCRPPLGAAAQNRHDVLGVARARAGARRQHVEWAEFFEHGERQLALTEMTGGIEVSTVFLGLDTRPRDRPPQLFETMVFAAGIKNLDRLCWRCATWDEALAQHESACRVAAVATAERR
jgi:hypothetical protein